MGDEVKVIRLRHFDKLRASARQGVKVMSAETSEDPESYLNGAEWNGHPMPYARFAFQV
jgi:hypothetical protein